MTTIKPFRLLTKRTYSGYFAAQEKLNEVKFQSDTAHCARAQRPFNIKPDCAIEDMDSAS